MACGQESFESGLARGMRGGVTMTGAFDGRLRFGFTERTGGVSREPYSSLNLGSHVGDDLAAVRENRRRVLAALGCGEYLSNLLVPNQVHGDEVAVVRTGDKEELACVRRTIEEGADAIVCTALHVPVMLCYADCVPVVITCEGGFAVVHSGWRGTYARISAKAATVLSQATGVAPQNMSAYIGPHILGDEYEVSAELLHTFSLQFANIDIRGHNLLDLSCAIRQTLEEIGVRSCEIHDLRLSTLRLPARFYSYRGEKGVCGRHGAVAVLM